MADNDIGKGLHDRLHPARRREGKVKPEASHNDLGLTRHRRARHELEEEFDMNTPTRTRKDPHRRQAIGYIKKNGRG